MASIDTLIQNISTDNILSFFQDKIGSFNKDEQTFPDANNDTDAFETPEKIGEANLNGHETLLVFSCRSKKELNERSAKKKQFEIAKRVLKEDFQDGAIFIFYDEMGKFRFSFIRQNYGEVGEKKFTSWKRYTYLVDPDEKTNKTFIDRIGNGSFENLEKIQEAFSVSELTKEFYNELYTWYQWVLSNEVGITFPNTVLSNNKNAKKELEEQVIRLITRLLFVWFIKQKNLIPDAIFNTDTLSKTLKDFDPSSKLEGSYYNAILQNLFFATLNKAIDERGFDKIEGNRDIKTKYRYEDDLFAISKEDILKIFHQVPFLNGGLFECLDKEKSTHGVKYHLDGFSRNATKNNKGQFKHRAFIPNFAFFDEKKGLIPLLKRYNFTVEENAPNEIQVALDPELLGKVFENLLGAFNPETKKAATARNKSGSFYTPREIVEYMTDEALFEYLKTAIPDSDEKVITDLIKKEELPEELRSNKERCSLFSKELRKIKILDPACGSGAFPMGILKRLVEILEKLENQDHYDLKLHLIEECIYGIDIQPIATQISRLRFFISLIVDQNNIDFNKPEENYGIDTLPNLETKFVAANTLLGLAQKEEGLLDLEDETIKKYKSELLQVRHNHFYARSTSTKTRLRKQDEKIRNDIKEYLTENASKPNETTIRKSEESIKELLQKRKDYEEENWVDDTDRLKQTSIFGDETKSQSLFRKDLNEKPRKEIDAKIKHHKKLIKQEKQKGQSVGLEKEITELTQWNPYDQNASANFFDIKWMFGLEDGFDVVIGNPPYISTKDIDAKFKKELKAQYDFADDTYSHFYFKGDKLLKNKGVLSYITSKTFWTIQTKRNLRDLILSKNIKYLFDTANPFEAVMVDTCIASFSSESMPENKQFPFLDGSDDLQHPKSYVARQKDFLEAQNKVIYAPTEQNLKIQQLYGEKLRQLYTKWWPKIRTSRKIAQNSKELEAYRNSLKPGDIALLGCLTEGGQGMATGNNGKYIAVRRSTKWAAKIVQSRPKKLAKAIVDNNIEINELSNYPNEKEFLESLSEKEIADLFDDLKEKYGRDIFGQGYLFKIVEDEDIADVEQLTADEKENGIDPNKKYYVPYDKGDKDGNRWFLETPFAIAWTKKNVRFLKTDPKARYQGYLYYFREGFCWTDVNSTYLKSRLKRNGVFDVLSMSLFTQLDNLPDWYFVCLINSKFISLYVDNFINSTSHFQINDARQLPVIIPNHSILSQFEKLFSKALKTKRLQFNCELSDTESKRKLDEIQKKLDDIMKALYRL